MPEGDTVWLTAQRLHLALSGKELITSDFRVPRYAEVDLTGREVVETISRGKHLLTRIGDDVSLHTHLKMEGSWHIYKPTSPWRSPQFQARVVLANASWTAVGFRLGTVDLLTRSDEHTVVGHLGPDLLGPDWDLEAAVQRLATRPEMGIGEALLDQRNLAGIGNMYKAEVCFLAGVHPGTHVGEVSNLGSLVSRAQRLLELNKERAEQSTTGDLRRGRQLWVYNRRGQPCRRCRTPIEGAVLPSLRDQERRSQRGPTADQARDDFWCPHCQPAPPT